MISNWDLLDDLTEEDETSMIDDLNDILFYEPPAKEKITENKLHSVLKGNMLLSMMVEFKFLTPFIFEIKGLRCLTSWGVGTLWEEGLVKFEFERWREDEAIIYDGLQYPKSYNQSMKCTLEWVEEIMLREVRFRAAATVHFNKVCFDHSYF